MENEDDSTANQRLELLCDYTILKVVLCRACLGLSDEAFNNLLEELDVVDRFSYTRHG